MIFRIFPKNSLVGKGWLVALVVSGCVYGSREKQVMFCQQKPLKNLKCGPLSQHKLAIDQPNVKKTATVHVQALKQAIMAVLKPSVPLQWVVAEELFKANAPINHNMLYSLSSHGFYKTLPLEPLIKLATLKQPQGCDKVAQDLFKQVVGLGNRVCQIEQSLMALRAIDPKVLDDMKQAFAQFRTYCYDYKPDDLATRYALKALEPLLQFCDPLHQQGTALCHKVHHIPFVLQDKLVLIKTALGSRVKQGSAWESGKAFLFKDKGIDGKIPDLPLNSSSDVLKDPLKLLPCANGFNQGKIGYHKMQQAHAVRAMIFHLFFGVGKPQGSAAIDYLFWGDFDGYEAMGAHKYATVPYAVGMDCRNNAQSVWEQWMGFTRDKHHFAQVLLEKFQRSVRDCATSVCLVQDTVGVLAKFKALVQKCTMLSSTGLDMGHGVVVNYDTLWGKLLNNVATNSPLWVICQALKAKAAMPSLKKADVVKSIEHIEQAMLLQFTVPQAVQQQGVDHVIHCTLKPCVTDLGAQFMAYLHQYLTLVWEDIIVTHRFTAEQIEQLCGFQVKAIADRLQSRLQVLEGINQWFLAVDQGYIANDQVLAWMKGKGQALQAHVPALFNMSYEAFLTKLKQQLRL